MDTNLDESVSNQDQASGESEEAAFVGEGEVDEAGAAGLEGVAAGTAVATAFESAELESVELAPSLEGLRSAAEATYGSSPQLESVIGDDERIQINNTDRYPWRVHASLLVTARDGSRYLGTAFFIGPRILATAGHNLFFHGSNPDRRGWARSIQVMPGRNGANLPYGSATSSRFFSVRGWTESQDPDYDYGAIILDADEALGNQTGWIGYATYGDSTLRSVTGNLSGYPADKGGDEQWYMARRINSVSSHRVFYDIDTHGGQSGSAVYRIRDGSRYAFGIHAYGVGARPLNSATRITKSVFDNLSSWKNDNS